MTSAARRNAPTLILIPTEGEKESLLRQGSWPEEEIRVELCGFGPVAAAARTAQLLAALRPRRALLLGVAGTLEPKACPVESVQEFDAVALDGLGAGDGDTLSGLRELGFAQWPGSPSTFEEPVFERIDLIEQPAGKARLLLTVCAASASSGQAVRRRARHPGALAEDMEGFGVALACKLARVPLTLLRGISNVAGDRQHSRWRIQPALDAVRQRALSILGQ